MISSTVTVRSRRCYLAAGSSALILAYAHFHTELWYLAFVALIPFLSQLCHTSRREAPLTGMILASFYVVATSFGDLLVAPKVFLFKFLVLNIVFGFLSLAITWLRSRQRFEPIIIALLTVPVSLVLLRWVNLEHLLSSMQAGANLAVSFYSLLAVLLWLAVLILGNSLILFFVRSVLGSVSTRRRFLSKTPRGIIVVDSLLVGHRTWYCSTNPRGPPTAFFLIASWYFGSPIRA